MTTYKALSKQKPHDEVPQSNKSLKDIQVDLDNDVAAAEQFRRGNYT